MRLDELTSPALGALLARGRPVVALVPVGSVEPHGPHLPLGTDTILGEGAARRAVARLDEVGVEALVAPSVPYGVTDFAQGFPGAVSLPRDALVVTLRAVVEALLRAGLAHVCLVSNHLEPAHDEAVRASVAGLPRASVASPLTRRHARTLSAEFKSGACHAGEYETSLVLAERPDLVDRARAAALPPLEVSLSAKIREGLESFRAMGMDDAYTGAPSRASEAEGEAQYARLADMIVLEVREGLARVEATQEATPVG